MSLFAPAHVLPQNSLQPFHIEVQNISKRTVYALLGDYCFTYNPGVEFRDAQGNPTPQYPPDAVPPTCPRAFGAPLDAGHTRKERVLAVANGISARAALQIGKRRLSTIATPKIQLGIANSTVPTLPIRIGNDGPYVKMPRPPGARGPLYEMGSTECPIGPTQTHILIRSLWTAVHGDRILAGCTAPREWHAWVGYVGYPIASISYVAPS